MVGYGKCISCVCNQYSVDCNPVCLYPLLRYLNVFRYSVSKLIRASNGSIQQPSAGLTRSLSPRHCSAIIPLIPDHYFPHYCYTFCTLSLLMECTTNLLKHLPVFKTYLLVSLSSCFPEADGADPLWALPVLRPVPASDWAGGWQGPAGARSWSWRIRLAQLWIPE